MRRASLPITTDESITEATYVLSGAVRSAQVGRSGFRMNMIVAIRQEPEGIAIYYDGDGRPATARFPYSKVRTIKLSGGEMVINTSSS